MFWVSVWKTANQTLRVDNMDVIVKLKRGINLRPAPIIEGDESLLPVITYGRHFVTVETRRIGGYLWGKNSNNQWMVLANGKNPWVILANGKLLPLG